jgi:hypothetical protein
MRLVLLCLVAWLVLVLAALASGGIGGEGSHNKPGPVMAR